MAGIKEKIQVNVQGAFLGVQEKSFSFVREFKALPNWKRILILVVAIAIIPLYLLLRFGTEQYLSVRYAREALSAHAAINVVQNPVVGNMSIIKNPNGSYSAVALVSNPNLDLAAENISYTASFVDSEKRTLSTEKGSIYLLPNEKKYLVFPKLAATPVGIAGGTVKLGEVKWQKRLNIPEVKLRASEPLLYDEANPLTFIAEGSIINDSPFEIGSARIVFLLFDDSNKIIGVSQRDEFKLVPFGRRAYKQLWPGLYRSQVKKIQVLPVTNTLDSKNVTVTTNP
jgi:hypothetical protein